MKNNATEGRNQHQIIRKDARNCFVESLNDAFEIGKVHFVFASYDMNRPVGQRQTNNINIYISIGEFLELCRKLECGEMRYLMQNKAKANDTTPIYQCLGGTNAKRLAELGRARSDGKSLSRTAQLSCGRNGNLLFSASSGPGETNATGLIVPKFGNKPENHVAVNLSFEAFSEFMLLTKMHYQAWLSAWYDDARKRKGDNNPAPRAEPTQNIAAPTQEMAMF